MSLVKTSFNIPTDVYTSFKQECAGRGLKYGDAIVEAMLEWMRRGASIRAPTLPRLKSDEIVQVERLVRLLRSRKQASVVVLLEALDETRATR